MTEALAEAHDGDLEARWDAILCKLETNADALARQGSLLAKSARGRRVWAVRFVAMEGGRRVQKAIYIGGDEVPELIERTASLLEEYRRMGRWADEVEGYARLAARSGSIARRMAAGRGRLR